jgi:hypothetical protein
MAVSDIIVANYIVDNILLLKSSTYRSRKIAPKHVLEPEPGPARAWPRVRAGLKIIRFRPGPKLGLPSLTDLNNTSRKV